MKIPFLVLIAFCFTPLAAFADSVSYSPLRDNQTPSGPFASNEEIQEDFEMMSKSGVERVRTFETGLMYETILKIASVNRINVIVGIDLTDDMEKNRKHIETLISIGDKFQNVESYIIGENELWDHTLSKEQLIEILDFADSITNKKISSINGFQIWNNDYYHDVSDHIDFLAVDMFYSDVAKIKHNMAILEKSYDKEILVETGHSTANSSKSSQEKFFADMDSTGIDYLKFEWADEFWKPDAIESGFGVYEADRTEKPQMPEPKKEEINPLVYIGSASAVGGLAAYKYFRNRNGIDGSYFSPISDGF